MWTWEAGRLFIDLRGSFGGLRGPFVDLEGLSFGLTNACAGLEGPCVGLRGPYHDLPSKWATFSDQEGNLSVWESPCCSERTLLRSKWALFRPKRAICRCGRACVALRGPLVGLYRS